MNTTPPKLDEDPAASSTHGLTQLLLVSAFAGALVGLVGGSFHWMLLHGSQGFAKLIAQWKAEGFFGLPGWLLTMVVVGLCVGIARWLVTFAPSAAGSGVQHVEAVMREEATPASFRVLPIKFLGGLFAMVPGLALGREGPTIQMAAVIGTQCGKWFGFTRGDRSLLYTAIAGSGLSVAFNAPLAGVAFVIEEVAHRITMRRLLATLIAVATAIAVYRAYFGNAVELSFTKLLPSNLTELVAYGLLGAWLGALGVLYNKSVLLGLNLFSSTAPKVSPIIKAGILGALIGLVAYWQPQWVGGGELQVNAVLAGQLSINALIILFLVRWALGPLSYSMSVPGGLFAPLLLVGATSGALFATSLNFLVTAPFVIDPIAFALVGMAAFFTAVVRAPFTGILLIIEMSGSVALVAPLIVASVAACLVANLMHGEPIYDSLRARMPHHPTDR